MSEQRISDVTERDIDVFLTYAERARESGRQPDYRTETIEMLWLDLLDARRERDDLRIENAQLCEKLAEAQRGEDIPGLVKRIAEAERELELARPVIEAAAFLIRNDEVGWRGRSDDPDEFTCECCGAHHLHCDRIVHTPTCAINKLIVAVRAYDAAREGVTHA
jgi:hypothetical protein